MLGFIKMPRARLSDAVTGSVSSAMADATAHFEIVES